uniref:Dynactin subunit 3 n=1 Tax=Myotis lucifugus TaxID=59463 RepID=G1Q0J6_MYOLU
MAAVPEVQRLQARVEELERWVYGPGGSRGSRKVADGLVKVQVALGNISSKRERVKILFKKIEDLIKYLDPEYIDRIAIPDASKLQFILAGMHVHLGMWIGVGGKFGHRGGLPASPNGKLLSGILATIWAEAEVVRWFSSGTGCGVLLNHPEAMVLATVGVTPMFYQ